eukprot:Phypoly_transcript_26125.p1 GENE.Phypoly_transcript_26125~~Phypoly_transcript_26125.p1  ORF type:complete len:142 (+),score=16.67 Phypoly_transcript_26125:28-426(+)
MNDTALLHVLSFITPGTLVQFSKTNKRHFQLTKSNHIWEPIVFQTWETVSKDVPIPSFYGFFKKRTEEHDVDFYRVCSKNVYLVHNMAELKERVAAKQCVAINFDRTAKYKTERPEEGGLCFAIFHDVKYRQ